MVLSVLLVFIIAFVYLKYPQVFTFKSNFTSGRYVRLEREAGTDAIGVANFVILDVEGTVILPNALSVNPAVAFGNGKFPQSRDFIDNVILIESNPGTSSSPYIEYDLGSARKISKIIIMNTKRNNQRMQKTVLRVLDEDRNQIFEKKISEIQDIYSINIS
jgi:hypothetical protein